MSEQELSSSKPLSDEERLELEKLRSALQEERARRTEVERQLEEVTQNFQRSVQARDGFLASMSHELRTPLNMILGLLDSLIEGVYGALSVEPRLTIEEVRRNGHQLLLLINDLLALSKLRAGGVKLTTQVCQLRPICDSVIQELDRSLQEKGLSAELNITDESHVLVDPLWFRRLLVQLLSNAIKFTPLGGRVGISAESLEEGGAEESVLKLSVWDTGIGISPDQLPSLGFSIHQLDSSLSRSYGGIGLGLAIVRAIAELHGSTLEVESQPQLGSKFSLRVPSIAADDAALIGTAPLSQSPRRDYLSSAPSPAIVPRKTSERPTRVLIVEDSKVDAARLSRYLLESKEDIELTIDATGGEVLSECARNLPDLILLDLNLPAQSGWEILRKLRANPETEKIPIVICSGADPEQERQELAWVHHYLLKPISRDKLRGALQGLPNISSLLNSARTGNIAKKILIVDDNQSNLRLVRDYLARKGFELETAEDGLAGVEAARIWNPDLILMDIQMPRMDGLEATRILKEIPALAPIPVIALTALAMPGDQERCLEAGMDAYFSKPVRMRQLYQEIQRLL